MTDLFDMRRDFSLKSLEEKDITGDPMIFFDQWLDEAIKEQALEPNAMVLSTSTADGKPSSRVVLLKQTKPEGFVFFTNYDSKKGRQLAADKYCALNFVWHELERQVRIEGIAEKLPEEESDRYFEVRPEGSKLGAWASPQSRVIPDRVYLENLVAMFDEKYKDKPIPRPLNWGGYIVKPTLIEFWQGRKNRLHDRIQYSLIEDKWLIERLAP